MSKPKGEKAEILPMGKPLPGVDYCTADEEEACRPLRLISLPGGNVMRYHRAEVLVGRHPDADLQIIQAEVSRRHCRLFHYEMQWYAEDLDSLNGTLVNGERIERAVLHSNDVLRIGDRLFQVEVESPASPAEPSLGSDHERGRSILRSIAAMLRDEESDLPSAVRRKSA